MWVNIKIVSYLFLCLTLICCKGTKSYQRTDIKESEQYDSYIIEKYSPYSRTFLRNLDKEILSNESFIPSSNLINDYSLLLINDVYYLGGLLKIREGIDEEKLRDMGVKINTKVNEIWTVKIPILQLKKIGNIEEINYIQIDEQVKPK